MQKYLQNLDTRDSIRLFYKKRFLRLYPPLIPAFVITLILTRLQPSFEYLKEVSEEIVFSILGIVNMKFFNDAGYFQLESRKLPLLHLWSLSIEIQYYLIFPILLIFFRSRFFAKARILALSLSLILLIGLIITFPYFLGSYYSPLLRFMELGAGSFLMLLTKKPHYLLRFSRLISIICWLALIGFSLLPASFEWNPLIPVLPLIFAFLLILCNVNAQNLPLSKVRYCIELIGRASYSIYIYHWLLIVFFASFFPKRDYLIYTVALCVFSIILGLLSYRFIEQTWVSTNRPTAFTFFIGSILFILVVSGLQASGRLLSKEMSLRNAQAIVTDLQVPKIEGKSCDFIPSESIGKKFCSDWNPEGSGGTILVWGDSFSNSWMPLFFKLADQHDFRIIQVSHAGCPPLLGVRRVGSHYGSDYCSDGILQKDIASGVMTQKIDQVFLIARWSLYIDGLIRDGKLVENAPIALLASPKALAKIQTYEEVLKSFEISFSRTISFFSRLSRVTTFLQTPTMSFDVSMSKPSNQLGIDLSAYRESVREVNELILNFSSQGIGTVDPLKIVCAIERCPAFEGSFPLYEDDAHPSEYLVLKFENEVKRVLWEMTKS